MWFGLEQDLTVLHPPAPVSSVLGLTAFATKPGLLEHFPLTVQIRTVVRGWGRGRLGRVPV